MDELIDTFRRTNQDKCNAFAGVEPRPSSCSSKICSCVSENKRAGVPPLPGYPIIGYLGSGSDRVEGNPLTHEGLDPGFRLPYVDMAYDISLDGNATHSVPVGVYARQRAHLHSSPRPPR